MEIFPYQWQEKRVQKQMTELKKLWNYKASRADPMLRRPPQLSRLLKPFAMAQPFTGCAVHFWRLKLLAAAARLSGNSGHMRR